MQRHQGKHCQQLYMRKTLLLLLIIASFAGCSKEKQVGPKEGQRFVHVLFPDQASCDQFRQQWGGTEINCSQAFSFKDDNKVTILTGDIINMGTYDQTGDMIIIRLDSNNGGVNFATLKVIDENTLVDPRTGIEWRRWKGPTDWDLY